MAESEPRVAANPNAAYETSDWPLRPVAWTYASGLILLAIAVGAMLWAYPHTLGDVSRKRGVEPPAPRLQIDPAEDLAAFRADKERKLNSYYWIDKKNGVVHIPIEQAMEKIVKSGIDGFPKAQP
ncbi:MAG TPA: hypothetical protein VKU03_00575 [Roseiarcus sp.]|nr:hypothetical protein [Roseiarcus sp.]